jgi:cysteine desulfurase
MPFSWGDLPRQMQAQATGKVEIDLEKIEVDLMSFSAHKTYGPRKALVALFVRRKPRIRIEAQIHGGGHVARLCVLALWPFTEYVGMGVGIPHCSHRNG